MATPVEEKVLASDTSQKLPHSFVTARLHSLFGLWLVIYLFEHLWVNSQAALFFRDQGHSFLRAVNAIHNLPYLQLIEIAFLAIPFLLHGIWGINYARKAKFNSFKTSGNAPALPQYRKNRAYTWQRITAWILVVAILLHVVQMRFLHAPSSLESDEEALYMVRVREDPGLALVASKLHTRLYNLAEIQDVQNERWREVAEKKLPRKGELLAASPSSGAAIFLALRDTLKNPLMVLLYTLFVIAACYHAFNGLWTFMISWGITLTRRAQMHMKRIAKGLMAFVMLLGLMAIWGIYWTYLFQR